MSGQAPSAGEDLRVPVCASCGQAVWPPRLLCPRCHGDRFEQRDGSVGTLEELTELGGEERVELCTVRLAVGPVVVARCDGARRGDSVRLRLENGALVARKEDER